ncbi:caspase family protein [Paenibacillus polymyxa]|uniref:caspase family protein n=1 Tax=Paenibacillus polymyxa TaxID=1406 RepID=UPI002379FAAC|nr:caspase family protein [Paenibacillus polymyxa]WDM23802.1 caspase family protein [Paenibacillus polymyxa]
MVGANIYVSGDYRTLDCVENDMKDMKRIFTENFNAEVNEFIGKEVVSSKIENSLTDFFKKCESNDTLILYWTGHGDVINSKGYLITYNSTSGPLKDKVSMEYLNELIKFSDAKSILVIVDCCHSGLLARNSGNASEMISKELEIGGKGRIIITSSNEESAYSLKDESNGVFTFYLRSELEEFIKSGDNQIDVCNLYSSIVSQMETDSYFKQIPCLKASIEGRFTLKLKEIKSSDKTSISNPSLIARGSRRLLDKLNNISSKSFLDREHYIKVIQGYASTDCPAGNVKSIIKHLLKKDMYYLQIEWFEWIEKTNLHLSKGSYMIKLTREQAEITNEMINAKKLTIYINYKTDIEKVLLNKITLFIEKKEVDLIGIYSRDSFMELPLENDNKFYWFGLCSHKNYLVTLDGKFNITKWDLDSLTKVRSHQMILEKEKILDIQYCCDNDTFLIVTESNSYFAIYLYDLPKNELIKLVQSNNKIKAFYSASGDFFIKYDKRKAEFISLTEEISDENFKFKRNWFTWNSPVIQEDKKNIIIYNYDKIDIFNEDHNNIETRDIFFTNLNSIVNRDLIIGSDQEAYNLYQYKMGKYEIIRKSFKSKNDRIFIKSLFIIEISYSSILLTNITTGTKERFKINEPISYATLNNKENCIVALTESGKILIWK